MSNENGKEWNERGTPKDFQSLEGIGRDVMKTLKKRRLKASLKILTNSFTIIIVTAPVADKKDIAALEQIAASYWVTIKLPYGNEPTVGRCVFVDTNALIY